MPAFQPIGLIRTPYTRKEDTPAQPSSSRASGRVELLPEYEPGLDGLEAFSHLILLYYFHHAEAGYDLCIAARSEAQPQGLFATRDPRRPNPIGLSVVRLVRREGRVLHVEGIDVLDGTPLLDVKPYVPPFDAFPEAAASVE